LKGFGYSAGPTPNNTFGCIFYSEALAKNHPSFLSIECAHIDWDATGSNIILNASIPIYFLFYGHKKGSGDASFSTSRERLNGWITYVSTNSDAYFCKYNNAYCMGSFELDVFHSFNNLLWSNFNVKTENGTVFLEESDPVPVYE
jgi:hypothetical protein